MERRYAIELRHVAVEPEPAMIARRRGDPRERREPVLNQPSPVEVRHGLAAAVPPHGVKGARRKTLVNVPKTGNVTRTALYN